MYFCDILFRIAIIKADNERLRTQVETLVSIRLEAERKANAVHQPVKREIKRDRRHIPGRQLLLPALT